MSCIGPPIELPAAMFPLFKGVFQEKEIENEGLFQIMVGSDGFGCNGTGANGSGVSTSPRRWAVVRGPRWGRCQRLPEPWHGLRHYQWGHYQGQP